MSLMLKLIRQRVLMEYAVLIGCFGGYRIQDIAHKDSVATLDARAMKPAVRLRVKVAAKRPLWSLLG